MAGRGPVIVGALWWLRGVAERLERPGAGAHLTKRDHDLLKLVMEGLTNREIAARMLLQEQTVKNYVSVLCQKLHVRNRVQLAVTAARLFGRD